MNLHRIILRNAIDIAGDPGRELEENGLYDFARDGFYKACDEYEKKYPGISRYYNVSGVTWREALEALLEAGIIGDIMNGIPKWGNVPPNDLYADEWGVENSRIVKGLRTYITKGQHPCAYVEISENHPFYGLEYDEVNGFILESPQRGSIPEITFAGRFGKVTGSEDVWVIGWDYAHAEDFIYYPERTVGGRIYTEYEILDDIGNVTEWVNGYEEEEAEIPETSSKISQGTGDKEPVETEGETFPVLVIEREKIAKWERSAEHTIDVLEGKEQEDDYRVHYMEFGTGKELDAFCKGLDLYPNRDDIVAYYNKKDIEKLRKELDLEI